VLGFGRGEPGTRDTWAVDAWPLATWAITCNPCVDSGTFWRSVNTTSLEKPSLPARRWMSAGCVRAPEELAEELAHRRGDQEIRSDEAGQSHLLEVEAGGSVWSFEEGLVGVRGWGSETDGGPVVDGSMALIVQPAPTSSTRIAAARNVCARSSSEPLRASVRRLVCMSVARSSRRERSSWLSSLVSRTSRMSSSMSGPVLSTPGRRPPLTARLNDRPSSASATIHRSYAPLVPMTTARPASAAGSRPVSRAARRASA
jgi:hypothetical protein